ncbi:MAG: N-6 DNA methylase [Methanomicrobia archaeon]|nr:N-6 DNA methylase [Methanomicrobia archaeon]
MAFVKSGILEVLGYEKEFKDIRFEKSVRGKRSDLLAFDDYQNVVFVVEFKRPNEINVERDFAQLWERYVKPLKARYGLLTDGLELLIYERINSNWERKLHVTLDDVTLSQCEEVYEWLKKPSIERTRIEEVLGYFERFDKPEEKVNLSTEIAQEYFFESFELKEGSIFSILVQKTIGLFDFELERSKFLKSAYNFWKVSYAKKPEKVPENWRKIMDSIGLEASEENLFKFMFCLESAYSLFTRLILAKACEDYKLPYIEFSRFIKTEIERASYRGDITLLAWAITTKNLIESMKQKLVKSVFEGDIFYWWEDSYKEISAGDALFSPRYEKQKGYFGEALAEIILTLYKFDFSEIIGDPLGTLYQRYFDKETRKALGEFYTPQEVVTYILDAVGYEGRNVFGKRLLDPACGSGTFLVEVLRRYLKASEQIADEKGWSEILKELCNEYCIVGFDIHPFATFMAQMQFMLVLIPKYKKAMEEDPHFVLNRLPIFRTDSLVNETKGEARKVTIEESAKGIHFIAIDTGLPVEGGDLKIKMPYFKEVIAKTDLPNVEEYFAALQAVFDTVKEAAWQEKYKVDTKELERNFKRYLKDRDWNGLVSFFTPYAKHFLQKFKELKDTFGDGKLIKSLEDIILAAILKNYVQYDFVVGNPPYVRVQSLPTEMNDYLRKNYKTVLGKFDLAVPFMERGINWLSQQGEFGFITSNKFIHSHYGNRVRDFICNNHSILTLIDFGDTGVFKDATNYPSVIIVKNKFEPGNTLKFINVLKPKDEILDYIGIYISKEGYRNDYIEILDIKQERLKDSWEFLSAPEQKVVGKIRKDSTSNLVDISKRINEGIVTGNNDVFINPITKKFIKEHSLEEELIYPILRGRNVEKWGFIWTGDTSKVDTFIIYPYKKENNSFEVVELDEYPNVLRYLEQYKDILKNRKSWRMTISETGKRWYELWHPNPQMLEEKIITPDISTGNKFSLDKSGSWLCMDTCFVIILENEYKKYYPFILGLLNSKLTEFYHKQISPSVSGDYYRYKKQYLEPLPIKLPQTPEEQKLADEITNKVERILDLVKLEQKIENFPEDCIQDYRSRGEEFDSKSVTFKSNHKTLEPFVEKTVEGGGYNIVIGKKETAIFVDSKPKADYVVAALKGKRAKKDEKLQLLVPKNDAIIEAILKELEEDKAQTKSPSVTELEAEINELVYKLYGLNDEDIKVIEEFLERF